MSIPAWIGVGSNLGNRARLIAKVRELFCRESGIRFLRSAPLYETEPVGGPPQGRFLNTVWEIETDLTARGLLDLLLRIESNLGRKREHLNEPRVIDLDLLLNQVKIYCGSATAHESR